MREKPEQGMGGLVAMSVANFGTAVAFALQQGNMSRIFQTLGAGLDKLPVLMIAGPVTGLLVQPLVGHFSDRTWGRFGRRRPYFFGGALFAALALAGMPYANALWIAALWLWVLDIALNVSIEPFRAFVAEQTPELQRTAALAFNASVGCAGAVLGFFLPYALAKLDLSNFAPPGEIPQSVRVSLWLAAGVILAAVSCTVFSTREYSPAELAEFGEREAELTEEPVIRPGGGQWWLLAGSILTALVVMLKADLQLTIVTGGIAGFGLLQLINRHGKGRGAVAQILSDLAQMPPVMRRLAAIHSLTWFALFIMWPFMTPVVTQYAFGATDPASAAYNDGADWVGILFVGYNVAAALFGFFGLPGLARRLGNARAHALCLAIGAASFVLVMVLRDPIVLFVPFVGLGVAWASILSLPYSILTGAVPHRKFGIYIGIFNIFIVVPQLLAAATMGPILLAWFPGEPVWTMAFAAATMGLAALLTLVLRLDGLAKEPAR